MTKKQQIIALRKKGYTLSEIVDKVGCAKSTASYYSRNVVMDMKRHEDKATKAREKRVRSFKATWAQRRKKIVHKAQMDWKQIRNNASHLSLVAFYWAEGTKRTKTHSGHVEIANSDPAIIKWCIEQIGSLCENEIILRVNLMPEHNKAQCINKWKEFTGIKPKVYVRQWTGKGQKLYSKYGVCALRVKKPFELWHRIMTWIQCWRMECGVLDSGQAL